MRKCLRCEADLPDNAHFCSNCGIPQDGASGGKLVLQAQLPGSGAIAQAGSVAAGEGWVAVSRDVKDSNIIVDPQGNVHIGDIVYSKTEVEELHDSLRDAVNTLRNTLTRRIRQAARTRPEQPYRYLDYFDLEHMTSFHGREATRQELLAQIRSDQPESRLTLLHAHSGAGKTSLLRAGMISDLFGVGDLPVYIHHPREPVATIIRAILPDAPHPEKLARLPLLTFLTWTAQYLEREETLVVLLDQFEEFFIHLTPLQQRPFLDSLADCYHATGLPVKFVLAIRKDYFSNMALFADELEKVFHNQLLLPALTREEAERSITAPLDGLDVTWEPGAVEALMDYLDRGETAPPHLQLICSRLYDAAVKNSGRTAISVKGVDLRSIHADYMTDEMSAPGFLPAQRELGWQLLKLLVTSRGTTQALPLEELYKLAPPDKLDPVLKSLVNRRLLRRDEDKITQQTTIEIAHDTLARAILAHESSDEIRTKAARELVSRGLDDWLGHESKPLLDRARLRILDEYHDVLTLPLLGGGTRAERNRQASEFLIRSALAAGHQVRYWFELVQTGGVDVEALLLERLGSADFHERAAAANLAGLIGEQFVTSLLSMLADDYPQVRVAATSALEKLQPNGAWREHLVYECYVPAGEFIMEDDETHQVHLDAYYIGKYPVTNTDYKRYMEDVNRPFEISGGKRDHPVVYVTWYDAYNYAGWAGMRLLTEAEWEKAARGATGRRYPWGNAFDKNKCNTSQSGNRNTTPAAKYSPQGDSPYGCVDMAGNVWEWCSSLGMEYPYKPDDGRENLSASGSRVLRGGSFNLRGGFARSASRYWDRPNSLNGDGGFRVGWS